MTCLWINKNDNNIKVSKFTVMEIVRYYSMFTGNRKQIMNKWKDKCINAYLCLRLTCPKYEKKRFVPVWVTVTC